MRFTFCPDCGEKLTQRDIGDEKNVAWCGNCNRPWFDMFYNCIIAIAHRDGKYALIRQKNGDGTTDENKFICVSGYIKPCETAEEAAVREVEEELGLKAVSCRLISTYAYHRKQMLMTGLSVEVRDSDFKISEELIEAEWFDAAQAEEKLKNTSIGKELFCDIRKIEKGDSGNGRN